MKCPGGCNNGFCDCATGECMCNPGFTKDTCSAAKCLNGNCAALYLGTLLSTVTTLAQLIDRHEWGCDFLGGDFLNAPAPLWQNCLFVCKDHEGCTHFAWMNGTCYMKKGVKKMKDKISNAVTACGCINC